MSSMEQKINAEMYLLVMQIMADVDKTPKNSTPTILDLPLKAKWYKMIESGEKKEEYREVKPFWIKRLMTKCYYPNDAPMPPFNNTSNVLAKCEDYTLMFKPYTYIRFRYGYTKRTMTFILDGLSIGRGNPKWGAPDFDVFILKLGQRVNVFE